ncbi:DNA primase [Streptococcus sp. HMSC063B03]|uniref:AAA family ATPase n=1 Tax=Streptococcus sp. HMSC063B03 TaxID=1715107 RepID=UPI0008A8BD1E|nr:AAA family ATPase [Streptococcus sp. HMSC063B03]OHP91308.1 DNA primase [Streptococcus sp. HMSC063B03]
MSEEKFDLLPLLNYIDPATLSYEGWLSVGMALKHEGYTAADWDNWSQNDSRYKKFECFKKWDTFNEEAGTIVTGATITQLAKENGWVSQSSYDSENAHELGWTDTIDRDYRVINKDWIEGKEIHEPTIWNPVQEIIKYLETLFEASENVGYVTECYPKTDDETGEIVKWLPTKGAYDRTAGQLIEELSRCNGDIGAVLGDYHEEAGAWVRFNPMDGKGAKNENVTDFRYALVESDSMPIDKQNAIYKELELPIAALVHSGNKSLHAIVKVDAKNYEEYRNRVDYLYKICQKNGIIVDTQNRNPSRLSRMPGFIRNGQKQFLVDTNIGKADWDEWYQYIEDLNDDLPDPEGLADSWDNLPELAPELIKGVLRQGHKMLIAGPSKAGKSFALIEMSIAIAEGKKWLSWDCTQGRVLYVNLELDRPSALHRFRDVYQAMGLPPKSIQNIDIWNLRGKTVPMDKLAPKLIRRSLKKNYIAVIIDPIYKVLTGDENSADQMAHFTNQFDKVATELGSSVIYCHHHSKGSQGGKKSMDRASGSGVFARDPDALIDLVELEVSEELLTQRLNQAACEVYKQALQERNNAYYQQNVGLDDLLSPAQMRTHFEKGIPDVMDRAPFVDKLEEARNKIQIATAWRVEGTLREFAKFKPVNMWFSYPVHTLDESGVLADIKLEESNSYMKKAAANARGGRKSKEENLKERNKKLETAYSALFDGVSPVTVEEIQEYFGVKSKKTVENYVEEHESFDIKNGIVFTIKEKEK